MGHRRFHGRDVVCSHHNHYVTRQLVEHQPRAMDMAQFQRRWEGWWHAVVARRWGNQAPIHYHLVLRRSLDPLLR